QPAFPQASTFPRPAAPRSPPGSAARGRHARRAHPLACPSCLPGCSGSEPLRVIGYEEAIRLLVLLDARETVDRLGKDVVGQIVIDGGDLADQHVRPFAPEFVP